MNLPPGVTSRIVMVRHGEPVASTKGMVYGKLDVGLSEKGVAQIEQTTSWLKKFSLSTIYSSPRTRATESARIVAETIGLPIQIEARFGEMDFGDFEGMTYDAVKMDFPEIYECWMKRPTEVQFPNGESFTIMRQRVLDGIAEISAKHLNETIAIFSHGGVNRITLTNALELPHANLFRFEQSYGCANVIDFYGDYPVTRIINHNFGEF